MKFMWLALVALLAAPQENWVQFSSDRGGFSVAMPGAPTETRDTASTPDSGPYETFVYIARTADEIYLAGWVDYRPEYNFGVQAELLANRDNFMKPLQGTIIESRGITFSGYTGIEFTGSITVGGNRQMLVTSRVIMVGRRPVMVAAMTPAGLDRSANIKRFLSSFQVTPR